MEVDAVLALIDKNSDYLDELYKEFNVLLSEVRFLSTYATLSDAEPVLSVLSALPRPSSDPCLHSPRDLLFHLQHCLRSEMHLFLSSFSSPPLTHSAVRERTKSIIRIFASSLFFCLLIQSD